MAGEVTAQTYSWEKEELLMVISKMFVSQRGRPGPAARGQPHRRREPVSEEARKKRKSANISSELTLSRVCWKGLVHTDHCFGPHTVPMKMVHDLQPLLQEAGIQSSKLGTHNHLIDNQGGRAQSLAPKYIL